MDRDRDQDQLLKDIALRVKELRERSGDSQETLANRIGMSRSFLAEVETSRRNVSVRSLARIVGGLGISIAEFFEGEAFRRPRHQEYDPPAGSS